MRALALLLAPVLASQQPQAPAAAPAANVFLVTIDGLRWQELFGGADNSLIDKEKGGVPDILALRRRYWRGTPQARREALLPFFWEVVATQGQVFGDPEQGAPVRLRNPHHFSYPGYHEILCGFVDARIDSNAKRPNPNRTVLEWLHEQPEFDARVAAFTTWDVFPFILNRDRSLMFVHACHEPVTEGEDPAQLEMLNRLMRDAPRLWENDGLDVFSGEAALAYARKHRPRVLYVALGNVDSFAHERRYDRYLDAIAAADRFLRRLWELAGELPEYRNRTALVVTTDHGRGGGPEDWTSHQKDVPGCDRIWIGLVGAGIRPLGLREQVGTTQSQIAATVADLLGRDWHAAEPRADPPLPR